MKLALIATGGTFDKEYNELNGDLYFNETHIPEIWRWAAPASWWRSYAI